MRTGGWIVHPTADNPAAELVAFGGMWLRVAACVHGDARNSLQDRRTGTPLHASRLAVNDQLTKGGYIVQKKKKN